MTFDLDFRDAHAIAEFLANDASLHLYELGDLDPFFWPHTTWFAARPDDIRALALLYSAGELPNLIALERHDPHAMFELLQRMADHLPSQFHAHATPEVWTALRGKFRVVRCERYQKMVLRDLPSNIEDGVVLGPPDLDRVQRFYAEAYPGNWFEPRMLETGQYIGIEVADALVCVAGVHVYSPVQRVAALGNIATLPAHRGNGYATRAITHLCRRLAAYGVGAIGLNVHGENRAAIRCYERLGFDFVAEYDELDFIWC